MPRPSQCRVCGCYSACLDPYNAACEDRATESRDSDPTVGDDDHA